MCNICYILLSGRGSILRLNSKQKWRSVVNKRDENTDARIQRFMREKARKYPELFDETPRKITVYKRGSVLDEINLFF